MNISCDVVFHETIFPFSLLLENNHDDEYNPVTLPLPLNAYNDSENFLPSTPFHSPDSDVMAPISPCNKKTIHDPNVVAPSLSHRGTSDCGQSSLTPTETPPRRSARPTRLPAHFRDYDVNHYKLLDPCYSTSSTMSMRHPISRDPK
ncbi:hypothetical protein ACOSQ4_028149 [Xanthoceras sorbifolium]